MQRTVFKLGIQGVAGVFIMINPKKNISEVATAPATGFDRTMKLLQLTVPVILRCLLTRSSTPDPGKTPPAWDPRVLCGARPSTSRPSAVLTR